MIVLIENSPHAVGTCLSSYNVSPVCLTPSDAARVLNARFPPPSPRPDTTSKVLRPMISIAPATHSFVTINTEHVGNATLFIGNPTYVDAEWSLSHVPAPPPKYRIASSSSNGHSVKDSDGALPLGDRGEGVGSPSKGGVKLLPRQQRAGGGAKTVGAGAGAAPVYVDDPSVFRFNKSCGVVTGVKLPLSSAAACLPEDWNRLEVCVIGVEKRLFMKERTRLHVRVRNNNQNHNPVNAVKMFG